MSFHGLLPKTTRNKRQNRKARMARIERALRTSDEDREEPAATETASSSRPDGETRTRERPEPTDEQSRESAANKEANRILAAARKADVVDTSDEDAATAAPEPSPTNRSRTSSRDKDAVDDEVRRIRRAGEKIGVSFK